MSGEFRSIRVKKHQSKERSCILSLSCTEKKHLHHKLSLINSQLSLFYFCLNPLPLPERHRDENNCLFLALFAQHQNYILKNGSPTEIFSSKSHQSIIYISAPISNHSNNHSNIYYNCLVLLTYVSLVTCLT